jgi:hypothetical protein
MDFGMNSYWAHQLKLPNVGGMMTSSAHTVRDTTAEVDDMRRWLDREGVSTLTPAHRINCHGRRCFLFELHH